MLEEQNLKPNDKKRLDWPDVAKGICIIAVIAGHMGVDSFSRYVYLWHLPVFFLLAGYFMRPATDKKMIMNKARRLLFPYYVTGLVILVTSMFRTIRDHGPLFKESIRWIYAILYAAGDRWETPFYIPSIGAVWFLWALFIALVITNHFIEKRYGSIVVALIGFFGWLFFHIFHVWLPLSVLSGMLCSIYLLIGYHAKKLGFDPRKSHWTADVTSFIVLVFGAYIFKGFWLVHAYMGNGWFDFMISLFSSFFILRLSCFVCDHSGIIKKFFIFCGRNSLMILCLHIIDFRAIYISRYMDRMLSAFSLTLPKSAWLILLFMIRVLYVCLGSYLLNKIGPVRRIFFPEKRSS